MTVFSGSFTPEHSPSSPGKASQPLWAAVAKQGRWDRGKAGGGRSLGRSRRRVREGERWRQLEQRRGLCGVREWWSSYLKDFGCLRELILPHVAESEGQDESVSAILLVGVQAALPVQWLYATHLLLLAGLFLLTWDPHQVRLHWETEEWMAIARYWAETAWGCECFSQSNRQGMWWYWRSSAYMWLVRSELPDSSEASYCDRCRDIYVVHAAHIKGNRIRRICARTQDNPPPLGDFKALPSCSVWNCLHAVQPWRWAPLWRGN